VGFKVLLNEGTLEGRTVGFFVGANNGFKVEAEDGRVVGKVEGSIAAGGMD